MAADPFSPRAQEPDEPGRLRALGIAALLMLATAFLYQAMDGVERAGEQAERRQRIAASACPSCALGDDGARYEDQAAADATAAADAAPASLHAAPVTAPTPTTVPAEPAAVAPVVPVLAPAGKPWPPP